MDIQEKANEIEGRAYQMYTGTPDDFYENPFQMYSYDRATNVFWSTLIEGMLERGLTEAQAEELLKSKHMRWMFDNPSEEFITAVKNMVTDSMLKFAHENA